VFEPCARNPQHTVLTGLFDLNISNYLARVVVGRYFAGKTGADVFRDHCASLRAALAAAQ
jgi:hypothetical protein